MYDSVLGLRLGRAAEAVTESSAETLILSTRLTVSILEDNESPWKDRPATGMRTISWETATGFVGGAADTVTFFSKR